MSFAHADALPSALARWLEATRGCNLGAAPELVAAQAKGGAVTPGDACGWVVACEARAPIAAVPVVCTADPLFELLADHRPLAAVRALLERTGRRMRALVVGTPLGHRAEPLADGRLAPATAATLLLPELARTARALGAMSIVWKDVRPGDALHAALARAGFHPFVTLASARVRTQGLSSLHDVLARIGAAASLGDLHRKMRDAGYETAGALDHLARVHGPALDDVLARHRERRRRLHGDAQPLRIGLERAPSPALLGELHRLYRARLATAQFRWESLAPSFFAALVRSPRTRLAVARLGDAPVAFSLSLADGDEQICLRSGIEPALARSRSLTVLMMLHDVELAIAEGRRTVELGPTGYGIKSRLAAEFEPTCAMMRLLSPLSALTGVVVRSIDDNHRRAGIHRLHHVTPRQSWLPTHREAP